MTQPPDWFLFFPPQFRSRKCKESTEALWVHVGQNISPENVTSAGEPCLSSPLGHPGFTRNWYHYQELGNFRATLGRAQSVESERPRPRFHPCLLAGWCWASYLPSWSLSSLVCNRETPPIQGGVREKQGWWAGGRKRQRKKERQAEGKRDRKGCKTVSNKKRSSQRLWIQTLSRSEGLWGLSRWLAGDL